MQNTTEKVIGLGKNENSAQYTWMMSQTQDHPEFSKVLMRLGICGKWKEIFSHNTQELQKKILDLIKKILRIRDDDINYIAEMKNNINILLDSIFNNIYIFDGEPKGVFEILLRYNMEFEWWLVRSELTQLANIITDYIKTDHELMKKTNNEIESIKSLCAHKQVIWLYDIINEYPWILAYNKEILVSLIGKWVKEFRFLWRWVNWFIISIWDEMVIKLAASQIDRNNETYNQKLFYKALKKISKGSNISNIVIPSISNSWDWYIEMQKVKWKTLLHYSIVDFFKSDLHDIGNVIKDASSDGNAKISYIYERLLFKWINITSDIDVLNSLNDEDLKNIFVYKQRAGSLKTDTNWQSVHDSLHTIGRIRKQEAIEKSVRYICLQNWITEEDSLKNYYSRLQGQMREAEVRLKEYGLSHNDFHQGNVMIEWDNSKRDFILYIIDFWEVKIDRMKNKIKMQE